MVTVDLLVVEELVEVDLLEELGVVVVEVEEVVVVGVVVEEVGLEGVVQLEVEEDQDLLVEVEELVVDVPLGLDRVVMEEEALLGHQEALVEEVEIPELVAEDQVVLQEAVDFLDQIVLVQGATD